MSVLEKIIQAERDASALLKATREESVNLLTNAHDELVSLKTKNAQDLAKQINVMIKGTNDEIAKVNETFVQKKEEISETIEQSAKAKKARIVKDIFKDITTL